MQTDWDKLDDAITGTCDHCGKKGLVILTNDPYLEEIEGEITEDEHWCYDCYSEALANI